MLKFSPKLTKNLLNKYVDYVFFFLCFYVKYTASYKYTLGYLLYI